nr:MAG TPA: hypothetical protein [Caudoviricetes sp.]DAV56750.1 MAG TPA: hypothetical protein [Caudoviricetes sp.]
MLSIYFSDIHNILQRKKQKHLHWNLRKKKRTERCL